MCYLFKQQSYQKKCKKERMHVMSATGGKNVYFIEEMFGASVFSLDRKSTRRTLNCRRYCKLQHIMSLEKDVEETSDA